MKQEPTVVGSWLGLILNTLGTYGIAGEDVLESQGVAARQIADPDYRIPFSRLKGLWSAAVEATGDESFGLHAGAAVHPTTFHALGMVLWSSSSLKQLFGYMDRYMAMFSTAARLSLQETVEGYCLTGRFESDAEGNPYETAYGVDATLAALVTLCRSHYGKSFAPLRVDLQRPAPAQAAPWEALFRCPVEFDRPQNRLLLDKNQLEAPLTGGNPLLAREMEKLVTDYLARMERDDLVGQIRSLLLTLLPEGRADKSIVADALHMSPRTLHRKLRDRGTSYQAVLDAVRHELALQYIAQSRLSLIETSFLLGFSNPNSFARAFKKWTGKSPQAYRRCRTGIAP